MLGSFARTRATAASRCWAPERLVGFFDAQLSVEDGKYFVALYGAKFELPEQYQTALKAKEIAAGDVKLGIRPEHIDVVAEGTPNSIRGRVDVSELMGSEMHMHVDIEGKDAVLRVQTPELLDSYSFDAASNNHVDFTFSPARIHLFSAEDGSNLFV